MLPTRTFDLVEMAVLSCFSHYIKLAYVATLCFLLSPPPFNRSSSLCGCWRFAYGPGECNTPRVTYRCVSSLRSLPDPLRFAPSHSLRHVRGCHGCFRYGIGKGSAREVQLAHPTGRVCALTRHACLCLPFWHSGPCTTDTASYGEIAIAEFLLAMLIFQCPRGRTSITPCAHHGFPKVFFSDLMSCGGFLWPCYLPSAWVVTCESRRFDGRCRRSVAKQEGPQLFALG
jgi:hypothetical protein